MVSSIWRGHFAASASRAHLGVDKVKAEHIKLMRALAVGNCTTLAAFAGARTMFSDDLENMGQRLCREIQATPERAAKERYRFIG